eukprot:362953-Chlamydomonas_euryale.AAC.2
MLISCGSLVVEQGAASKSAVQQGQQGWVWPSPHAQPQQHGQRPGDSVTSVQRSGMHGSGISLPSGKAAKQCAEQGATT